MRDVDTSGPRLGLNVVTHGLVGAEVSQEEITYSITHNPDE